MAESSSATVTPAAMKPRYVWRWDRTWWRRATTCAGVSGSSICSVGSLVAIGSCRHPHERNALSCCRQLSTPDMSSPLPRSVRDGTGFLGRGQPPTRVRQIARTCRIRHAMLNRGGEAVALTTQTYAEQVGRAYAEAARGHEAVLELWVTAEPGTVHVWMVVPPIDADAELGLHRLSRGVRDRFGKADFMLHILNPRDYPGGDARSSVPRGAAQIPLHSA